MTEEARPEPCPDESSPTTAEGCGCIAMTAPDKSPEARVDRETIAPPEASQTSPAFGEDGPTAPSEVTRRAIKLVVTLQPDAGPGYRAIVALGAEGCDPVFYTRDVQSLSDVLDEVPALVAEAEISWQTRPRYPKVALPTRSPAPSVQDRRTQSPAPPSETQSKTAIGGAETNETTNATPSAATDGTASANRASKLKSGSDTATGQPSAVQLSLLD